MAVRRQAESNPSSGLYANGECNCLLFEVKVPVQSILSFAVQVGVVVVVLLQFFNLRTSSRGRREQEDEDGTKPRRHVAARYRLFVALKVSDEMLPFLINKWTWRVLMSRDAR